MSTRNLARLAEDAHERRGDYDALCFEGTWFRSAELLDRGARLARGLVELGVKPGDRVVVMMENSADVGVVYHAIARAGAVVTPVIFLVSAEELRRMILDAEPALVIASPLVLETVEAAANGLPSSPSSPSTNAASRWRSFRARTRTWRHWCTREGRRAVRRA